MLIPFGTTIVLNGSLCRHQAIWGSREAEAPCSVEAVHGVLSCCNSSRLRHPWWDVGPECKLHIGWRCLDPIGGLHCALKRKCVPCKKLLSWKGWTKQSEFGVERNETAPLDKPATAVCWGFKVQSDQCVKGRESFRQRERIGEHGGWSTPSAVNPVLDVHFGCCHYSPPRPHHHHLLLLLPPPPPPPH